MKKKSGTDLSRTQTLVTTVRIISTETNFGLTCMRNLPAAIYFPVTSHHCPWTALQTSFN
jgi:hypothetical protein